MKIRRGKRWIERIMYRFEVAKWQGCHGEQWQSVKELWQKPLWFLREVLRCFQWVVLRRNSTVPTHQSSSSAIFYSSPLQGQIPKPWSKHLPHQNNNHPRETLSDSVTKLRNQKTKNTFEGPQIRMKKCPLLIL